MKPWIKKTLMGIFGASIAVGGLTACSSGHHHRGPMTAEKMAEVRGKMVDRVSSKLDLNEVQKTKLNALADQLEAQRAAFIGKTADPRAEVQAIVAGDKSVDIVVRRLRKKLEPLDCIKTLRNAGYSLALRRAGQPAP